MYFLQQYFCLLLAVLVAQISAAVWMYANNDKLVELVRYTVKTTVQLEYGSIEGRTETFDAIQSGVSIIFLFNNIYNFFFFFKIILASGPLVENYLLILFQYLLLLYNSGLATSFFHIVSLFYSTF